MGKESWGKEESLTSTNLWSKHSQVDIKWTKEKITFCSLHCFLFPLIFLLIHKFLLHIHNPNTKSKKLSPPESSSKSKITTWRENYKTYPWIDWSIPCHWVCGHGFQPSANSYSEDTNSIKNEHKQTMHQNSRLRGLPSKIDDPYQYHRIQL